MLNARNAWLTGLLGWMLAAPPLAAHADEPSAAAKARAETIAPLLGSQTKAVVWIDLKSPRMDPWVQQAIKVLPTMKTELAPLARYASGVQATLLENHIEQVYCLVSLSNVTGPLLLVGTAPAGFTEKQLKSIVESMKQPALEGRIRKGRFLIGLPTALDTLEEEPPNVWPELAAGFHAAGNSDIQLILRLTDDDRRVLRELQPTLPAALGGGPISIVTQGLRWMAVGLKSPPKLAFKMVIQSDDAEAAEAFRGKLIEVGEQVAKQATVQQRWPEIQKALPLIWPQVQKDRLVLELKEDSPALASLLKTMAQPLQEARADAHRMQAINDLKQIALGIHNFADTNGSFPAVGSYNAAGKPLLSWRVHLLPYMDHIELYQQFHHDEPWDSPHNKTLISKMPFVFLTPGSKLARNKGLATYRVPAGKGTVFSGTKGTAFRDIVDGTSNTILVIEVPDAQAVTWTKPEGYTVDLDKPQLGGHFDRLWHSAFCDGSVHTLSQEIDRGLLKGLLTMAGGEVIKLP